MKIIATLYIKEWTTSVVLVAVAEAVLCGDAWLPGWLLANRPEASFAIGKLLAAAGEGDWDDCRLLMELVEMELNEGEGGEKIRQGGVFETSLALMDDQEVAVKYMLSP